MLNHFQNGAILNRCPYFFVLLSTLPLCLPFLCLCVCVSKQATLTPTPTTPTPHHPFFLFTALRLMQLANTSCWAGMDLVLSKKKTLALINRGGGLHLA